MVHQEVTTSCQRTWKLCLYTAFGVILVAIIGCSTTSHLKHFSQSVVASRRDPGETMVSTPEKTREKYACTGQRGERVHLEEVVVLPEVATAGKEINQRIRYALCPMTRLATLRGQITRTVLFKGKIMLRDVTDYEFKPGTWLIDVNIGIPKDAASGPYAMDILLRYNRRTIRETKSFMVKN